MSRKISVGMLAALVLMAMGVGVFVETVNDYRVDGRLPLDDKTTDYNGRPLPRFFVQLMRRCWATEPTDRPNFREISQMFKVIGRALMEKNSPLKGYAKAMPKEWEGGGGDHVHVSTPEGRLLEVSSGGVQSNARSLAKMGALLANGGALDDVTLCSAASVDKAMGSPKRNRDNVWCMDLENSVGGFFDFGTMLEIALQQLDSTNKNYP